MRKKDGLAGHDCIIETTNNHRPVYKAVRYYYDAGGQRRFITGFAPRPSDDAPQIEKDAARQAAILALQRNVQRRLETPQPVRSRKHRLSEAIDGWWEEKDLKNIADSSRDIYEREIKNHLRPNGAERPDKPIAEYTTDELQAIVDEHPSIARFIQGIWGYAERMGWLPRGKNPAKYLRIESKPKIRDSQERYVEDWIRHAGHLLYWLSDPTNQYHRRWYAFFLIELVCGLRRGEVCGLRWGCVDLRATHESIRVEGTVIEVGGKRREQPYGKTDSSQRTVHMPRRVEDALLAIRPAHPDPNSLVFHTQRGTPLKPSYTGEQWNILQRAFYNEELNPTEPLDKTQWSKGGYTPYRWRQHDNRHIFASILEMEGIDFAVRQDLLGHARPSVTDRYTQTTKAKRREAIELVDDALLYHGEPDTDRIAAQWIDQRKRKPQPIRITDTINPEDTMEKLRRLASGPKPARHTSHIRRKTT